MTLKIKCKDPCLSLVGLSSQGVTLCTLLIQHYNMVEAVPIDNPLGNDKFFEPDSTVHGKFLLNLLTIEFLLLSFKHRVSQVQSLLQDSCCKPKQ